MVENSLVLGFKIVKPIRILKLESNAQIKYVFTLRCKHFLNSVLGAFQDYFSYYETGQSVGVAKTGEPHEKTTTDTPVSRTWLVSHVAIAGLGTTRHSGEIKKQRS